MTNKAKNKAEKNPGKSMYISEKQRLIVEKELALIYLTLNQ
jgi:hypothetical protein